MAACAGQPGKAYPNRTKRKEILNCQGNLLLCEVCEYVRFGEESSRKPKKSTKERKKSTKSTEAGDENTPGNSSSQVSNDGEKPGGKIGTEETLVNVLECKFCSSTSTDEDDKLLQCDRCDFGVCL